MDFSSMIKRAWHIMWRYKALWVLGIFAGVSGCQSSFGGSSSWSADSGTWTDLQGIGGPDFSTVELARLLETLAPVLVAMAVLMLAIGLVWAILSIAARGALIVGVSEIEEGRPRRLGDLWRLGFSRFWPLVGLGLLLNLPIALLVMAFMAAIFVPIGAAIVSGSDVAAGAAVVPICGSLIIGVPVLIIASFVLGIMYLVGQRYIMLGGQGVIDAAGNSWRFLRARTKDSVLLYLLNAALNMAAGLVLVIPIIVLAIGLGIPIAMAAISRDWGLVGGLAAVLAALIGVVVIAYTALWGTFTSALWTLYFRDLTGMSALPASGRQPLPAQQPAFSAPSPSIPPAPPMPDA